MINLKTAICLLAIGIAMPAMSVEATSEAVAGERFNPKVNNWAEGTVMSIDVDARRFTVRGTKRPYASAYAKMMKEIHTKTSTLSADDSAKKTSEIRAAWQPELEKARAMDAGSESSFTFYLPGKDGSFNYFDEAAYYDNKTAENTNPTANLTAAQQGAMRVLKDLKIGEYIVVGYDGGVISNDAYTVIKARTKRTGMGNAVPSDKNESTYTDAKTSVKNSLALDDDTESARKIRRAVVEDKELSTAAHNVNIKVENGVAHLRGAVPSEKEKTEVDAKAAGVVGTEKVMSHLEVKQ